MRETILLLLMLFLITSRADAQCRASMLNPFSDTCWECMFPARIGGNQFGGGEGSAPGETDSPACMCVNSGGVTVGLNVAFWEHARLIETVKDPFCMPTLGTDLGGDSLSKIGGGNNSSAIGTSAAFQQVHYYIYPVWSLLGLFGDMPCIEQTPFDMAYMTELDPLWNDDVLAFILNPEALLFGNPVTQLSCMADSAMAITGKPLDPLFWCMGSWGSSYPLTGNVNGNNPTTSNALLASRMIFKLGREMLLRDTAIPTFMGANCSANGVLTPIMNKSHYKLQVAKPRRGSSCVPIGQSDFIWGPNKNPPWGTTSNAPDNFLWIMLRARTCCVGYSVI